MIALALNGVIAVLLVATVAYCVALSRRLHDLRGSHGEFATLIETFSAATVRAESGLAELRKASKESGAVLDERIKAARALSDDLAFLVERGAPLADRLEGRSESDRKPGAGEKPATASPRPRTVSLPPSAPDSRRDHMKNDVSTDPRSAVERDLASALRTARRG